MKLSFNENTYSIFLFIAHLRLHYIPHYLSIRINDDDVNANGDNNLTNIDSLRYRGICARKNQVLMRHTNRDITVNNITESDTERVATRARDNRRREKQIGEDGIKMCEITRRRRALKMTDDFNIARMTKKLNC